MTNVVPLEVPPPSVGGGGGDPPAPTAALGIVTLADPVNLNLTTCITPPVREPVTLSEKCVQPECHLPGGCPGRENAAPRHAARRANAMHARVSCRAITVVTA